MTAANRIRFDASSRMPLEPDEAPELTSVFDELAGTLQTRRTRYVELTARSCFSFLRGGSKPEVLVHAAKLLGYDTIALTDYGGIYGTVRAWEAAKQHGLKLILGAELELAGDRQRLTLLVQNARGYANLCHLLTRAHAGRRPWVDPSDKQPGAKSGEVPDPVLRLEELVGRGQGLFALLHAPYFAPADAAKLTLLHQELGPRLALALAFSKDGHDRARFVRATDVSRRLAIPIVATGDVRFATREDKELYDVLQCIREKTPIAEAGRRLLPNTEARLKSEAEMQKAFGLHPEWIDKSRAIADSCTFTFDELQIKFPSEVGAGESPNDVLRQRTETGLENRYGHEVPTKVREQVERELALIAQIDVAPYFLSVHDIVQIAREKNILCQGRGSAANSAVCYVLGITAVDPSQSNLLFERFLSAERAEPPDIDVDFEHERREEVIQAIYEKYGRHRAAMVSEVISYRARSAVRDVAKVYGFTDAEAGSLAKGMSPWGRISEVHDPSRIEAHAGERRWAHVLDVARRLQGYPRHLSIHVGGFVVSAVDLTEVAPVEPASMPNRTVIPWDKDDLDTLKFFKLDVLGLGMMTAVRRCLDTVYGTSTSANDRLARIPKEDPKVYEALCRADTVGVFQIESRAQMAMLPRLKPEKFYDLVVEVAIVRPGPIQGGMVHPYLKRRMGKEATDSPHPCLTPILERTLGVPLFQEQVMQIAITGAGYTGGEADQLRRDMAAWRRTGNLERHKEKLHRGFLASGISAEWADRLYAQIEGFAEYGFPESHASSFALLVYASSWLKLYHPAAFAAALVNSLPMGFYSASTLFEDARRHGVTLAPVCVNYSNWECTLTDTVTGPIRVGLQLVKGLGETLGRRIETERAANGPYATLEELVARTGLAKDDLEHLAEAGALESITTTRRAALYRARAPRETSLFASQTIDPTTPTFAPLRPTEQLVLDYERTGITLGDHPMALLRPRLSPTVLRSDALRQLRDGLVVDVAGMVICRQRPATASGVVFFTLEDEKGFVNLVVWSTVYDQLRSVLNGAHLLQVRGKLQLSGRPEDGIPHTVAHVVVQTATLLQLEESAAQELPKMSRDFH